MLTVGLALVAAACGDDDSGVTTTAIVEPSVTASSEPEPTTASTAPAETTASTAPAETTASTVPAATVSTTASTTAATVVSRAPLPADAVASPGFELALGEGGTFASAGADQPIYMVFWAEW